MVQSKPKLIVLVGPTASGKSELAIQLAKKFRGEIISADSRQIYQGLTVATGKVPGAWRQGIFVYKGIPHYLVDEADPRKQASVAQYQERAERRIAEISQRAKLPILVGGTGFWIDAVVYGMDLPGVPPNPVLRRKLEKMTRAKLLTLLQRLDPKRAASIDRHNPRRLTRAIEIATGLGSVPPMQKKALYDTLWIGIQSTPRVMKIRIHDRLKCRLAMGMVREAARLHRRGLAWKRFYQLGLEYRYLADYLRKKISREKMECQLEHAIRHYARRQITWWRKNPEIHWISRESAARRLVRQFIGSPHRSTGRG